MAEIDSRNADQVATWGGASGRTWTARQEHMDAQLAPVSDALFAASEIAPGARVIDIGCGCGDTSLALVRRVGPAGHVLGLDISAPMLARARERAPAGAPVEFIEGDATIYPFAPASADLLFSRFGVMFFADPVASFANMRKALRPGGRVLFACWRAASINPSLSIAATEAARVVPPSPVPVPPPPADAPGPFAFADAGRVRTILSDSGFADIAMTAVDVDLDVAAGKGLDAAVEGALEIGPASRLLRDQPENVRSAAAAAIRTAYATRQRGQTVPLPAAIWIVTARSP